MSNEEKLKVLITEDDEPTRILLRASISQWGYEVVEAKDGEDAWRLLNEPNPPEILLLDWLMPKLDGIGLCQRIIAEYEGLRPYILFLSNLSSQANMLKGIEVGGDEFMSKPFNVSELHTKIDAAARRLRYRTKVLAECTLLKKQLEEVRELIMRLEKDPQFSSNEDLKKIIDLIEKGKHEV